MLKKHYRVLSIGIIGLIIVAVTLSVYFLLKIEKTTVTWLALSFVLLAEVALTIGFEILWALKSYLNAVFIRSGISIVLFVYFIATVVFCLFADNFKSDINTFIIIEIVVTAVTAIVIILIMAFSRRINNADQRIGSNSGFINNCQQRTYNLLIDSKNSNYQKQLHSLYEDFKFSDKIGRSSVDIIMNSRIDELEQSLKSGKADDREINSIFDELFTMIAQRKMEVSESKRGGF